MTRHLNLVIGASENKERYSNLAIRSLLSHGKEVVAIGNCSGQVLSVRFDNNLHEEWTGQVDTVTLYINPARQEAYYDYIIRLKPRRVIFNPGTENPELIEKLRAENIEPVQACTLVMLSIGNY